jgi:hypothetical protein
MFGQYISVQHPVLALEEAASSLSDEVPASAEMEEDITSITEQAQTDAINKDDEHDNFRMNTGYGRYRATYNMVGLSFFNDELPCV